MALGLLCVKLNNLDLGYSFGHTTRNPIVSGRFSKTMKRHPFTRSIQTFAWTSGFPVAGDLGF
jgi:hypothetical protein